MDGSKETTNNHYLRLRKKVKNGIIMKNMTKDGGDGYETKNFYQLDIL